MKKIVFLSLLCCCGELYAQSNLNTVNIFGEASGFIDRRLTINLVRGDVPKFELTDPKGFGSFIKINSLMDSLAIGPLKDMFSDKMKQQYDNKKRPVMQNPKPLKPGLRTFQPGPKPGVLNLKDIMNITGRSKNTARKLMAKIRLKYNIESPNLVPVKGFCEFTGMEETVVKEYI